MADGVFSITTQRCLMLSRRHTPITIGTNRISIRDAPPLLGIGPTKNISAQRSIGPRNNLGFNRFLTPQHNTRSLLLKAGGLVFNSLIAIERDRIPFHSIENTTGGITIRTLPQLQVGKGLLSSRKVRPTTTSGESRALDLQGTHVHLLKKRVKGRGGGRSGLECIRSWQLFEFRIMRSS